MCCKKTNRTKEKENPNMENQSEDLLLKRGIRAFKSKINNHIDHCIFAQITVDGQDLPEEVCPHFNTMRDIQRWSNRFPNFKSDIIL